MSGARKQQDLREAVRHGITAQAFGNSVVAVHLASLVDVMWRYRHVEPVEVSARSLRLAADLLEQRAKSNEGARR